MNKIIPALSVFILASCSTEQIKTSAASQAPLVSVAPTLTSTLKTGYQFRHHTTLKFTKVAAPEYPEYTVKEDNLATSISSYLKQGLASWYGPQFHGKKTSNGEIFDMYAMTAAHKTLPLSSYAQVTNLKNHRSVIVRINDRGPFHGNRLLDLSYAAAKKLDITQAGTGNVEIKAITPDQALPELQQIAERQEKQVYLQVGTFGNQKKALKLKDKIAANHLPQPKILHSRHKKSTLYKVQIGPIKSTDSVDELSQKLARLGITETRFVSEVE
ncbi:MAG: septal ring lytic transglycosylase RlpA family protein [Methylococcales bacterium]